MLRCTPPHLRTWVQQRTQQPPRQPLAEAPILRVLAGTNGAGKSSIAGAFLHASGGDYFNPDEVTREIAATHPNLSLQQANGLAWQLNVDQLRRAIREHHAYSLETTLGGATITKILKEGVASGLALHVWYAGLDSPERHLSRVAARVAAGGHDIPEAKVRARYLASLINLIALIPLTSALEIFDNSAECDPVLAAPQPKLVLRPGDRAITYPSTPAELAATPTWAQPVVALGRYPESVHLCSPNSVHWREPKTRPS